jgi:hypothetical protein
MAQLLQFGPQALVIVGFAVVDQVDRAGFIAQGLVAAGQVNDAQTARPQPAIPPFRKVGCALVRPAMNHRFNLGVKVVRLNWFAVQGVNSGNSTHFDFGF